MTLNQSKENFGKWLRSQPGTATAIAGDPYHCWLAQWFESQGCFIWGVYPQHETERIADAPGNASQEVLLADPEDEEFSDRDRIPLEEWASQFGSEIDRLYYKFCHPSLVSRDRALAVLAIKA